MKYFITTFVVIVFVYLVIKYKIHKKSVGATVPGAPVPAVAGDASGISIRPLPSRGNGFTYFEVLAFSRDVEESDSAFAERVSLHLARAAGEINGKGYHFTTSYATLSGTLVVLLTYSV